MGWRRGTTGLMVEKWKGKNKKLIVRIGNEKRCVAVFRDDESAELFDRVLDYLIEGGKHEFR